MFSCQIKRFRALRACFRQLEHMKLYSSQKCFLGLDFAQNVWIWHKDSVETWFHLFHHSFQSDFLYCQITPFRALGVCFRQLEHMKLYSGQKCFLSLDFAQSLWIWPNHSVETWFHLFHHSFQSDVFSCQIKRFRALQASFVRLEKMKLYSSQKCFLS